MKLFKNRRTKGAISIFLVIITVPTMLFAAVLIDGSRMASAKAMTQEAADLAASSALASYNQRLKDDYGLFAINDNSRIEDIYKQSLASTLMAYGITDNGDYSDRIWEILKSSAGQGNPYKGQSFLNLYDFSVEKCTVTPLYSLANWQVLENQMVEYAKFRGVYIMTDRLGIFSGLSEAQEQAEKNKEASEVMQDKMDVDEANMGLDTALKKLRDAIAALNVSVEAAGSKKDAYIEDLAAKMEEIKYSNIDTDGSLDGSAKEKAAAYYDSRDALTQELSQLPEIAKEVLDSAKSAENERKKAVNRLKNFRDGNSSKAGENESISEMLSDADKAIQEYEGHYRQKIQMILNDAVIKQLSKDDSLENDVSGTMDTIDTAIHKDEERIANERAAAEKEKKEIKITEYFYYYLDMGDKTESADAVLYGESDSRCYEPAIEERIEYFIAQSWEEINPTLDQAREDSGFSEMNDDFAKEQSDKAADLGNVEQSSQERGRVENSIYQNRPSKAFDAAAEMNSSGIDGFYSGKGDLSGAKNIMSGSGDSILLKIGEAARDDVLCLSYMFGTFKTRLTGTEKFSGKQMAASEKNSFYMPKWRYAHEDGEIDMRFSQKRDRDTVLRSEIEYLVWGFQSDQANEDAVYSAIFAERLANNVIAMNADKTGVKASCQLAAAGASALTQGIVPQSVFYWIFLTAWAAAETFMEMDYLLNDGYRIPLIKTKDNLLLKTAPIGDKKQVLPNYGEKGLFVSYEDYLLLMLLLEGEKTRLMRSADLIEMNMKQKDSEFTMSSAFTYLRADTDLSLRYLFGSVSPFQSEYEKNGVTGRMRFTNTIYQGY